MHVAQQALVLGLVLVQILLVAVPPPARGKPVQVAGRSLLRPRSPSRSSRSDGYGQHLYQQKDGMEEPEPGGGDEEEGGGEGEGVTHHARRGLEHEADVTISLFDQTATPDCPAVEHRSNSTAADDRLRSAAATVGTAEVWAKLQLAESRGEADCRAGGSSCCRVSGRSVSVCLVPCEQPSNNSGHSRRPLVVSRSVKMRSTESCTILSLVWRK